MTTSIKKTAVLLFLCCLTLNARAQEVGIFNHLATGVKIGSDGIGLELAAPIGPYFQVSLGYSILPALSYNNTFNVPEHPGESVSNKGAKVPTDVKAASNLSGLELLFHYFPFSNNHFHISAGLMFGSKKVVKIYNTTPLPSDYNIVGIDVDGYTVKAFDSVINGYLGSNQLRPYIGIGYGRAFDKEKRVCLALDLGAMYWGNLGLYAPGEPLIGECEDVKVSSSSINGGDKGLIDAAEKISFYPMLKAGVYIKLF